MPFVSRSFVSSDPLAGDLAAFEGLARKND